MTNFMRQQKQDERTGHTGICYWKCFNIGNLCVFKMEMVDVSCYVASVDHAFLCGHDRNDELEIYVG
jgi:hypothetical protein